MRNDSRQHGFEVESGANYLADFAKRFELAYRACQFVGSLIQFFEQADIFYGYYGLIRKGFEEHDLCRREGAHLGATCAKHPNKFSLLPKRNGQERAPVVD